MRAITDLSPREIIRYWLKRTPSRFVTPSYLRSCIEDSGYDMQKFGHQHAYFYTLLGRMEKAGEIVRDQQGGIKMNAT